MENLKVVYLPPGEIIPYDKNPRRNDQAVDAVAKSIAKYGFRKPIILTADKVIIAGHTAHKASIQLGLETIPCVIAHDLTEEQANEYRVIDNKVGELADWDYKLLAEILPEMDLDAFDVDWDLPPEIDWASVNPIASDNYEKPEHIMLRCPKCLHVDRQAHFKKVNGQDDND